jgi:hypothetical protein
MTAFRGTSAGECAIETTFIDRRTNVVVNRTQMTDQGKYETRPRYGRLMSRKYLNEKSIV